MTSYNSTTDANDLSYTYDADGNRVLKTDGEDETTYTYNDAGKLVCITYPDEDVEEFLYDGDGMRKMHRPKGAGSAAWVRFTEWGSICDENLETPEEIYNYMGVEIFHDTYGETDTRFYTYNDYIGSVRQIVTDAANPVDDSRFDYTAYGLNDSEKDYSGLSFNAKSPSKFVGMAGYYDGSGRDSSNETADGMVLCGQRWYDPQIGRWLTEDPIGFHGGLNLYAYCSNCPTGGIDPTGTVITNPDGTTAYDQGYGAYNGWIYHHYIDESGYNPNTGGNDGQTRHYYMPVHSNMLWPGLQPPNNPTPPTTPIVRTSPLPSRGPAQPGGWNPAIVQPPPVAASVGQVIGGAVTGAVIGSKGGLPGLVVGTVVGTGIGFIPPPCPYNPLPPQPPYTYVYPQPIHIVPSPDIPGAPATEHKDPVTQETTVITQ